MEGRDSTHEEERKIGKVPEVPRDAEVGAVLRAVASEGGREEVSNVGGKRGENAACGEKFSGAEVRQDFAERLEGQVGKGFGRQGKG